MKNHICTILGGGGFIGRYLVRNLTKKNYRCIISTRKAFQKGYLKTQATPGSIELIDWNPNNFSELKEAIKNSDIDKNIIDGVDYYVESIRSDKQIPSKIIKVLNENNFEIIRS